jgi:hypothetical protein
VTFVAASGDNGAFYGPSYPAASPNVLAVGGTALITRTAKNGNTVWGGEQGWTYGGGGKAAYEGEPLFQYDNVGKTGYRMNPDVSYDAGTNGYPFDSAYDIYDTIPWYGYHGWFEVQGTSAGSPQWAAIITLADQARQLQGGQPSLDNLQVETTLYSTVHNPKQYALGFHDITLGDNGYPAHERYDLNTGLGSPKVNNLVPMLAGTTVAPGTITVKGTGTGRGRGSSTFPFGAPAQGGDAAGGGVYATGGSLRLTTEPGAGPQAAANGAPDTGLAGFPAGTGGGFSLPGQGVTAEVVGGTALLAPAGTPAVPGNPVSAGTPSVGAPVGLNDMVFGASGWKGSGVWWRSDGSGANVPQPERAGTELDDPVPPDAQVKADAEAPEPVLIGPLDEN